jgi:hypothetical protein
VNDVIEVQQDAEIQYCKYSTSFVIVVPKHVDFIAFWRWSQLTETYKGIKFTQIESQWMVLSIVL